MLKYIVIHPADNVAVALQPLEEGESITCGSTAVKVREQVPAGHKVSLAHITAGQDVIKYGSPIGHATETIEPGRWVNDRMLRTNLKGISDYRYQPVPAPCPPPDRLRTFSGYARRNGEVGIRNELWIIPTVGCVNGVAERLARMLEKETRTEGIDGIRAYTHNYGCSQLGDDHEHTRRILRDMALHPNAGGVLIVGLGCENNQPDAFRALLGDYDTERIRFMVCQHEEDEMESGMTILRDLYARMVEDRRTEVPMGKLRVGLKCGGSDGFSGITANPLLGCFSDYLVAQGGTTVLTEVPEMFGAETLLMARCKDEKVFRKTVSLINDFKNYFISHGQPVFENPSPGNKAGGISTLEEKSLGCTQKSGTTAVCDVLEYGETLSSPGLNLLSAPGNDLVASTALAASGCHIVLFTTGRGTPFDTIVVVALDGRYAGYLLLADEPKPDASRAVTALHSLGIRNLCILSGDKSALVGKLAGQLGISRYFGDLMPEDKVRHIEEFQTKEHARVAFVGDGLNDAPVLAASRVGIAMGGLGSDVAIEAADIILQTDQPSKIAEAIRIGRRTRAVVWQNIIGALGVKLLVLALGASGAATLWEAVFADVGVALLAILNAVRLLSNKKD